MKTLFLALIILAAPLVSMADSWEKTEHNWNIKYKDFGLNVRNQFGSNYDHVEASYKLGSLTAAMRFAEKDGANEYRPKLTHKVFKWKVFDIGHRIEYRHHDGSKDSNWRYRLIGKASVPVTEKFSTFFKIQPRWEFGKGKDDDLSFDDIKNQFGVKYKHNKNLSFSPHVMYVLDDDFNKKSIMFGTALTVKF